MTPQSLGGLAVASKTPPRWCPRCRADFRGRSWHSYIAHKGLHGYADRFHSGDIRKAAQRLARNGLAVQDAAPWNGAFPYQKSQIFKAKEPTMTTDFKQIQFNADKHRYTLNGQELTSVTTAIKQFQKPFDRDGAAERVAKREGRTAKDVILEWEAKGERSRVIGTAIHSHIEQVLRGNINGQLDLDPFLNLNTMLPEIVTFNRFWQELCPKVSYHKDHIEWIIGDQELGLVGTVDTLLFSPESGKYHIWDWKSGNFDLNNKWDNLLHPFGYLDASKLHIYSLQVSLYRLIIERNTDLELGDSYLVHLTPDGHQVHRAVDLREKLVKWVEIKGLPF